MHDNFDYGQGYHAVHYFLYLFVVVHQTLTVMWNQVCKIEYKPYNPLMCFVVLSMVMVMFISYLRDGDVNFKMCCTLLCGVVGVFLAQFIVTIIGEFCTIIGIEVFTTKEEVAKRIQRQKLKEEAADLRRKKNGPAQIFSSSHSEEAQIKKD